MLHVSEFKSHISVAGHLFLATCVLLLSATLASAEAALTHPWFWLSSDQIRALRGVAPAPVLVVEWNRHTDVIEPPKSPNEDRPPPTPHPDVLATYRSSEYGWSVAYPSAWRVDDSRPHSVFFASEELASLCGVHAGTVRFDTAGQFADFMLKHMDQSLREQNGFESGTLWRRDIRLASGQVAVEALVAIRPGGMSHRLFTVVSHLGLGIDCEAEGANWPRVTNTYDQIIASFSVAQR